MAKKQKKDEITYLDGEYGADWMYRSLTERLKPKEPDPEQVALEAAREKCRKGNPFPLIALQWPDTILTDPEEIEIFQRHMREERFAHVTDSIRDACFDSENPHLRLDWWQKIILAGFFAIDVAEIYIKGCTGAGKGGSTSIGFSLWYDIYDKSRISLTGRDKDHAVKNIFGETKSWFQRMQYRPPGNVLGESINDNERHYIKLLNPDPSSPTAGEAFSGAHGPNTLCGFDEQSALPDSFVENALKNARKIVSLSNPRDRVKDFYRAFEAMGNDKMDTIGCCTGRLGKRLCVTIGGPDCMNVAEKRLKTPVAPAGGFEINGRTYGDNEVLEPEDAKAVRPLIPSQMDVLQFRSAQAGFLPECFAFGRFPKEDVQRQVIAASWLKRHEDAWHDGIPVTCAGVDVALSLDGDSTVLAVGGDSGCRAFHSMKMRNPLEIAREIVRILKETYLANVSQIPICVDLGGGYGSGVSATLKEMGCWVIEFVHGTSSIPRTYRNLRAEAYGTLGLRLDPSGPMADKPWALPRQEGLRGELCAPERDFDTDRIRWKVQPKDEIKAKLGRSPDYADALTYLFHAVRRKHELDQWLFSIQNRPLICFPSTPEETREIVKAAEEAPPPKTEWDDIAWDWSAPKEDGERTIVVSKPDKNPRRPWWERYTKDD